MSEIAITIDGRQVRAPAGATVLDAARAAGIYIPTLCMDDLLKPYGACRLCLVSVEGLPYPASSCTTPVEEGMVVRTSTPAVDKARRLALDLIVADHPLECLTCRKNGRCELQKVAAYMGVTGSRLRATRRQVAQDSTNPFYDRDMAKCIMCGRCVRACDEIRAVHAIDYIGRSFQAKIGTAMDRAIISSNCESCGQCVDTCPVGALVDRQWSGLPDREVRSVCPYCGCGCGVVLQVKGGRLVGATADRQHPVSKGSLCVKGRFGLDFVHHPERLTSPLIKREGKFVEASWDEALDLVADKLAQHRGAFAALASAKCTNEENYLLQKFTRGVMGTNNIDHCARI